MGEGNNKEFFSVLIGTVLKQDIYFMVVPCTSVKYRCLSALDEVTFVSESRGTDK